MGQAARYCSISSAFISSVNSSPKVGTVLIPIFIDKETNAQSGESSVQSDIVSK